MKRCPACSNQFPNTVSVCPDDGSVLEAERAFEDEQIGRLIDSKYKVEKFISQGGMGAVFRATHVMLGKEVAVKLIKPELASSPELVKRFLREGRAATKLQHAHIVTVYDMGQTADGMLYIVMEFVRGRSLKELIRSEPIATDRALNLLSQLASAIAHLHANGIVHRDLKPQNLMIASAEHGTEHLKLLDFGIAKTLGPGGDTKLTETGSSLGTPHYMSPEQIRGEEVDERSDIYSFGVIAYELLTGRLPFEADSVTALLTRHLSQEPDLPSRVALDRNIHPSIESLVMRCLRKVPAERFSTAADVAASLVAATKETATVRSEGSASTPSRRLTRLSMVAAVITFVIGASGYLYFGQPAAVAEFSSTSSAAPPPEEPARGPDAAPIPESPKQPESGVGVAQAPSSVPSDLAYEKNVKSGVKVSIFLNDQNGRRLVPVDHTFKSGDEFEIELETNARAYVYVLNRTLVGKPQELAARGITRLREEDRTSKAARDPYKLLYPLPKDARIAVPGKPFRLSGFRMDDQPGVEKLFVILSPAELNIQRYFDEEGNQVSTPPKSTRADDDLLNSLNAELVTMSENSEAIASRGITRVPQGYGLLKNAGKPGMMEVSLKHDPR